MTGEELQPELIRLTARVHELEARSAITELVHEYCRVYDLGDHVAMANLFTEDCTTDYGPSTGGERHGRDAVEEWLRGIYRFRHTSHHLSNVQIQLDGPDHATGTCYVLAWHRFYDETERPPATLFARYQDVYERTGDRWQFAERRELAHGQVDFDVEWNYVDRKSGP